MRQHQQVRRHPHTQKLAAAPVGVLDGTHFPCVPLDGLSLAFYQFRFGKLEKQLTVGLSYSQVNAWTHRKSARMRGSPTPALPKAAAQWEVAVGEAGNLRLGRADLKEKAAQCEPRTTSMSPLRWGN